MNDKNDRKKRSRNRSLTGSILYILVITCLVWWFLVSYFQERFIFPRFLVNADVPATAPVDVDVLIVGGDAKVEAFLLPGAGSSSSNPAPMIVILHGNAELIDDRLDMARRFASLGDAVLLPEYRGYGRSGGSPGQEVIREDVLEAIERATARADVDGDRVGYYGVSIGTAIAADVALRRSPACMVFIVPPASISGFAWSFGAPPFLIRHPFRTDLALAELSMPILICSNAQDEVVPAEQARALHEIAGNSTLLEFEGRHNFLFDESEEDRRRTSIEEFCSKHLLPP